MKETFYNYAFIDAHNLHMAIQELGWKIDYKYYNKAVIVSGDGDFHCLIKYLQKKTKLQTVLVPTAKNCSILIKKIVKGNLTLVSDLKKKLQYKKRPLQDRT